ncbi:MAG: secondary thiamine-phosphate synthase enzyme YjbQ [Spirochaetaceae bacterium]
MSMMIEIRTTSQKQFANITREVQSAVTESGIDNGICVVYVPHTTAGVTVNEAADPSVAEDAQNTLRELVPRTARYSHAEGNADSHIQSILVGPSVSLIVEGGRLALGTWQGVFFCEFDGPRSRTAIVQCVPG